MAGYSALIAYTWISLLERDGWQYGFDEENGYIRIPDIKVDNKLEKFTMFVSCRNSDCIITGTVEKMTPPNIRNDMAQLISRINYDLSFGGFQMDHCDGQILFCYSVDVEDGVLSEEMVNNAQLIVYGAMKRYGDALVDVMEGCRKAKEAYERSGKKLQE